MVFSYFELKKNPCQYCCGPLCGMGRYIWLIDSRSSGEQSRQRESTNAWPISQLHQRSSPPDMSNSLPTQERKPHIQADIFGNCSGMASLIPSKPPSLPFSPDLFAYSHLQVPNTGYLDCLWNLLCPSLRWHIVLMLLPASWNAMLW